MEDDRSVYDIKRNKTKMINYQSLSPKTSIIYMYDTYFVWPRHARAYVRFVCSFIIYTQVCTICLYQIKNNKNGGHVVTVAGAAGAGPGVFRCHSYQWHWHSGK